MKKLVLSTLLVFLTFLTCTKDDEQPASGDYEIVATGFSIPWGIEIISENEYLFTERLGTLYFYKDGAVNSLEGIPQVRTVIVAGLTYGGLMDVSLHPNFQDNKFVYITFVNAAYKLSVARFKFVDEAIQDLEVIFESNAFSIGSRIAWQDDSHFFVTQGLGGNPYPEPGAQDLNNDGGKIHRFMADGQIPKDNPIFEGTAQASSIWSYGHRDPQGLFYDKNSETLYSNEHGPLGGDELNIIVKGGNYGWPLFSYGLNYDGTPVSDMTEEEAAATTVLPIKYWDSEFNIAPSGLVRLSGSVFGELDGTFLMGSLAKQRLINYTIETNETKIYLENIGRIRDVAPLPNGELLILIDAGSPNESDEGRILKLSL